MLELRGLRGKSGAKVKLMLSRIDVEAAEFERCTARLHALRAVQQRLLREALGRLSGSVLRSEVAAMQSALGARPFNLGGKQAFATLCARLRQSLDQAQKQAEEIRQMLDGSFLQLNAEYGFAFSLQSHPELERFGRELDLIDHNYSQYLGLLQSWRMASPGFMEQFRRMLLSKLRVVFEGAASELELWSRAASNQVDLQLAERRRAFKHRRESLERIQSAAGELEQRIAEVEAQDARLEEQQKQLDKLSDRLVQLARGQDTEPAPLAEVAASIAIAPTAA
jgi:ABC-type multidrug transport system fused ATPase/permease subunit